MWLGLETRDKKPALQTKSTECGHSEKQYGARKIQFFGTTRQDIVAASILTNLNKKNLKTVSCEFSTICHLINAWVSSRV